MIATPSTESRPTAPTGLPEAGGQAPTLTVAVILEQCWHRVPGGTARAALATVEAVRATGAVDQIGVSARHRHQPAAPWVPGIPVVPLGVPRPLLYETWHRIGWPRVESVTGTVEVIHATGLAMPPRTVPIVATLHDLAFLRHPDYFTRHGLAFFDAALRRMRRDADVVLVSSEATRSDAEAAGFEPDRLRVVPLGVEAPTVTADRVSAVRRRLGIDGRYVLHLGTDEPRKNLDALRRSVRHLPDDVVLVTAGAAGWGDRDAVVGGDRVRNPGFVSEADKWALLAGAAVVGVPSFWEGFGLPALEAMSVGTPVVTSVGTALAEVVGDAGICVDPRDDDAIVEALRAVLDDEGLAIDLGDRGRRRAAAFTWERTATLTIDAYRDARRAGPVR